jgi:hypothetical protein
VAGVSSFPYGLCAASPQVSRGIRLRQETPSESDTDPPGRLWLPLAGQTGRRARPVCSLIPGGLPSGEDMFFMHGKSAAKKTCPRRTGRPPSDEVQGILAPSSSADLPEVITWVQGPLALRSGLVFVVCCPRPHVIRLRPGRPRMRTLRGHLCRADALRARWQFLADDDRALVRLVSGLTVTACKRSRVMSY